MAIYAASLVILFLASATYHMVDVSTAALRNFRRADHAAIAEKFPQPNRTRSSIPVGRHA